jgi:hypothetical protein
MRATWYVLENGNVADPSECAPGKGGILTHKSGVAVEMRGETPRSRGVDPDEERAKAKPKPKAREAEAKSDRQMKAEDGKGTYKTR